MYALIKTHGLIVQDVVLFTKEEDAEADFLLYTGIEYDKVYGENGDYSLLHEDYDETKILEVAEADSRLPYFDAGANHRYPNYPENEYINVTYKNKLQTVFFTRWQTKEDRPQGAVLVCKDKDRQELFMNDLYISAIEGRKFTPAAQ